MTHDESANTSGSNAQTRTHDELLAYMNKEIDQAAWTTEYYPFKPLQALRAVVELHKPFTPMSAERVLCMHCSLGSQYEVIYPCPTIQAIEKELG